MSVAISLENLYNFPLPVEIKNNSNSLVEDIDKIIEKEQILESKFLILKKDIGDKLFNQLSYEQKKFIINVSGTINLGKFVDIDNIYNRIEKLEYE